MNPKCNLYRNRNNVIDWILYFFGVLFCQKLFMFRGGHLLSDSPSWAS